MYIYSCKVLKVIDGDTIDIEIDLGFHIKMKERVRLISIDTPEVFGPNAEPAGQVASQFAKDWIEKRQKNNDKFEYHSIKYNARDKYGRSLGYIYWKGGYVSECLNFDLEEAGFDKEDIECRLRRELVECKEMAGRKDRLTWLDGVVPVHDLRE